MTTILGVLVATLLTLALFSRVLGEQRVFQYASHLLLGLGAGYVAAVVLRRVLLPAFTPSALLSLGDWGTGLVAGLLILSLATRFSGRGSIRAWGWPALGLIAGVGSALVLAGAVRGTLLPQLAGVSQLHFLPAYPKLDVLTVVMATLTSLGVLLYFLPPRPTTESRQWVHWLWDGWRWWGYAALMLALGALLASTAGARITLLIDRIQTLLYWWFGG